MCINVYYDQYMHVEWEQIMRNIVSKLLHCYVFDKSYLSSIERDQNIYFIFSADRSVLYSSTTDFPFIYADVYKVRSVSGYWLLFSTAIAQCSCWKYKNIIVTWQLIRLWSVCDLHFSIIWTISAIVYLYMLIFHSQQHWNYCNSCV